jgi:cytochrome c biogenesis protein
MTIYQADWELAAITVQIGKSPELQLPLRSFPELGEQIWGLVLPTRPDGSQPVLMSLSSEQGPIQVFDADGSLLGKLRPGGTSTEIKGLPLRVVEVMPASGLLLKRDPGVPLVYAGFAITLLGGGLSLIATRQLWAVLDSSAIQPSSRKLHIGGLCNRNLAGFAAELPILISKVDESRD